jgi:hypothetical protein
LVGLTVPLAKSEVAAIAIDLTNCGHQIMHVRFHLIKFITVIGTVFTATLLPALELMAKFPGGDYVFPLDTVGAGFLFTDLITTAGEIGFPRFAFDLNFTATVKADCGQSTLATACVERL